VSMVRTCSFFLPFSTSASASDAPIPSVFPNSLISSTSSFSLRSLICASMSSAVVSLRALPSRDQILFPDMLPAAKPQIRMLLFVQGMEESSCVGVDRQTCDPLVGFDCCGGLRILSKHHFASERRVRKAGMPSQASLTATSIRNSRLLISQKLQFPTLQWDQDSQVCFAVYLEIWRC
jgi:hypothetical protein